VSFTFVAVQTGTGNGVTSIATGSTLNVAAGDLLIGMVGVYNDPGTVTMADSDGTTNVMTMLDKKASGGGLYTRIGYVLSATADATASMTVSSTSNMGYAGWIVYQFRPDAGETVSYESSDIDATGSSTTPQTGDMTTTGTDEVMAAILYLYNGKSWSGNRWIADVEADGATSPRNEAHAWYNIFSETKTDAHAQALMGGSDTWLIDMVAFKSAAAAASGNPWHAYAQQ